MSFSFESLNTNSKRTIKEGITTDGMNFVPLAQFIGQTITVDGFFFTTGKYGDQVVVIANGNKINVPKRFVDQFKQIRDNDEALSAVLAGKLQLANIRELDSKNGKTVTFDFKTV